MFDSLRNICDLKEKSMYWRSQINEIIVINHIYFLQLSFVDYLVPSHLIVALQAH